MEEGYKKLEIYNLAHTLGVAIHEMTMNLPKFETYEEGSQIRRSAKSVSTNIVEGFALRKYKNEYIHYLYRAYGSSEETVEHIRYLFETKSLVSKDVHDHLLSEYHKLNGMMFRFIQSVERNYDTPNYLKEPDSEYRTLLNESDTLPET